MYVAGRRDVLGCRLADDISAVAGGFEHRAHCWFRRL